MARFLWCKSTILARPIHTGAQVQSLTVSLLQTPNIALVSIRVEATPYFWHGAPRSTESPPRAASAAVRSVRGLEATEPCRAGRSRLSRRRHCPWRGAVAAPAADARGGRRRACAEHLADDARRCQRFRPDSRVIVDALRGLGLQFRDTFSISLCTGSTQMTRRPTW